MAFYRIDGGHPLNGTVKVSGNKNAVLPMMAACVLVEGTVTLTNVPAIRDVDTMAQLLESVGCKVVGLGTDTLTIDSSSVLTGRLDDFLVSKLRGSILMFGPLIARVGKVSMRYPGGCVIGRRPVGTHFDAFSRLGVAVTGDGEHFEGTVKEITGTTLFLDEASVTATENVMMAAVLAKGTTVIRNAACEPHVVCLAQFLQSMGADIKGIGTNEIRISGVSSLTPTTFRVRSDHVEAGSFAVLGALGGGKIEITGVELEDMTLIMRVLSKFSVSVRVKSQNKSIVVTHSSPSAVPVIRTGVWPAFPTDLMSVFIVLATQAKGVTLCHDWMYEGRMYFTDKLVSMGAQVTLCDPHRALIFGPTRLRGKEHKSPDLRAGMAFVVAALIANGVSEIHDAELIERGYGDLVGRLSALGARIERVE